jgi:D-inositol-3-phosphate glycosyltransferase
MKVAFLCSSFSWGGLEINNLRLCSWLQQRGHQPILICPAKSRLSQEATVHNIGIVEFDHRSKHLAFGAAFRLSRILQQLEIRTLIIGHYRQHYSGIWTKVFARKKLRVVYWQQMQVVLNRKDFYHAFFFRQLDAWITPLNFLKQQLLANTVLKESRIHVIPLGVELSRFVGASLKKLEARSLVQIRPEEFLVGIVGRLDKQKGQETLLRAIKVLKDKGIPVKGILIGEESYGHEGYLAFLQALTKELQIEKEIYFRSFMKDVAIAFACLDIFVMASLSEPIGMVTVEAMAAGIPVIGTNSGGTPELLGNGEAGVLFEPSDYQQLADRIFSLFTNPHRRSEIVNKALERTAQYSHDRQCQLFEDLMKSLQP